MSTIQGVLTALDEAGLLVEAPQAMPEITGVTDDSRSVRPGMLFCAVAGTVYDGHRFIPEAIEAGATVIVVSHQVSGEVQQILCRDSRLAASVAAAHWYGEPGRDISLIGVTGTNGKTTTVSLIRHILNEEGTVGSIGTLGAIDSHGRPLEGHDALTTPGSVELQEVLAALRRSGVSTVVMEASSHALHQGRLATLELAAGVFTNLTHEHLDYHGTLEQYLGAKALLVDCVRDDGALVINADDEAWAGLTPRSSQRTVTFGTSSADVLVSEIEYGRTGSRCTIGFDGVRVSAVIPLPGHFNVSNAAAAATVAWALGMEPVAIAKRIASAEPVPGRMELLVQGEFSVIRDYAHTPDALERAITALRPVTGGRLIVLFGAGGDRDKRKRRAMGEIAERLADIAVVTSDNPRTEDPDAIMDDIETGMPRRNHVRITDRREAVYHAIALLEPDDCLLLAGKGHEICQIIGTDAVPFDEREIVEQAMAQRAS